jgi:hypothetical protein
VSWEAVSAIGQVVGAAGMIVSILYLAQQIRANTRATKASASFEATHSWALLNETLASHTDEMVSWQLKVGTATGTSDFSDIEWIRLTLVWRAVVQRLEGQYYLQRYGLLEPDLWRKRSGIVRGFIDLPVGRIWWERERSLATFTDEFVAAIEASESVDATRLNRR